jgi:hypothetical protein
MPQRIRLKNLNLISDPGFDPVRVDSFGQRKKGNWPGKVSHVRDLIENLKKEKAESGEAKATNPFGGDVHGLKSTPTGRYYVRKSGAGFTLVDPLGYPFWSLGVTGVRLLIPGFRTPYTSTKDREFLFEKLPPDSLRPDFDKSLVNFYHWNVVRKYGNRDAWKLHTEKRLRQWGFNTLGNWSDLCWTEDPVIPYTLALRTNSEKSLNLKNTDLPDVFNPRWVVWVDSVFTQTIQYQNDSFLLGYFVDNEFHWQNLTKMTDSSSFTFRAWKAWKEKGMGGNTFLPEFARRYF